MRGGNTQVLEHLCELSSLGRIVGNHPALTYLGGKNVRTRTCVCEFGCSRRKQSLASGGTLSANEEAEITPNDNEVMSQCSSNRRFLTVLGEDYKAWPFSAKPSPWTHTCLSLLASRDSRSPAYTLACQNDDGFTRKRLT